MEPPAGRDPETLQDTKRALFRSISDASPAHYVRGQYDGYRDTPGVAPDSSTETYAALRFDIDNWRWAGVPFFVRTGKHLAVRQTELRLLFRHPPHLHFVDPGHRRPEPNQIVFKIDPSTGIRMILDAHRADDTGAHEIEFDVDFAQEGGEGPTPYEVLLHAALVGDATHFTRQDNVEECWRIVQPLLDSPPDVLPYAHFRGTAAGTAPGCPQTKPKRGSPRADAPGTSPPSPGSGTSSGRSGPAVHQPGVREMEVQLPCRGARAVQMRDSARSQRAERPLGA